MSQYFGLSTSELEALHNINPELAAHNIATAYINTASHSTVLANGEDVVISDVLSLANQYVQAYQYAYNLIVHENDVIDHAE